MGHKIKNKKSRRVLLHQYYKYTGFYDFIKQSLKKATPPIIILIATIIAVDLFVFDISQGFEELTQTLSPFWVLTVFFISESILGLIPPEIFIAWSAKMPSPIIYLFIIAMLSYLGGLVSYFIGLGIKSIPSVHQYLEVKMKKHLKNTSKWGGFLIIIGALLPVPFSLTCMAGGIIKYPFKGVVLYGLLRFIRFALYALVIFNVL